MTKKIFSFYWKLTFLVIQFSLPNIIHAQSFEELKEKADQFTMVNIDSSIHYYLSAEKMAINQNDSFKINTASSALASLYNMNGELQKAIEQAQITYQYSTTKLDKGKALSCLGKNYEFTSTVKSDSFFRLAKKIVTELNDSTLNLDYHLNLAGLKLRTGDLYGAIDNYLIAEENTPSQYSKASIFQNINNIFNLLENYDRAIIYAKRAADIMDANDYKGRNGFTAIVYAHTLLHLKRFEESNSEINRAIEYGKKKNSERILIQAYNIETELFIETKSWPAAKESNKRAFQFYDDANSIHQISTLKNKSRILFHENKYNEAIDNAEERYRIASQGNFPLAKQGAYYDLYLANKELNKIAQALTYFEKHNTLKDSIFNTRQLSLVNSLESKFNRKEQENAIALLDAQNEIQSSQLSQQRTLLIIGGIALGLISLLSFFLYRLFKKVNSQKSLLSKALGEKDILLREIHHRVKNNLQLVSSLLGLQSDHIEDPQALEALNSGKSRVKSMALIHQDLYKKENLTGLSVQDYLHKLSNELINACEINPENIELKLEVDDLQLDVDTLVPLGLIINELITNSLKYAFPNGQKGYIHLQLFEKGNQLYLNVEDNGVGINPDKESDSGFGFQLIETLLEQLEGEMNHKNGQGTHLSFKMNYYKKAA